MEYYFIIIIVLLFAIAIGEIITGKMLNLNFIGIIATRLDLSKEFPKIVFLKFIGYLSVLIFAFWLINIFPAFDFSSRGGRKMFIGTILLFIALPIIIIIRKFRSWVRYKKIKQRRLTSRST